jgi:CIC family chloride channel protein
VLSGETIAFGLVLALLVGKLVLTPVSIGSGFPGGVFAPSLFIGALVGEAFGQVATALFPQMGITPAAFAMVGMAAVLAGAVHTPLTAVILLFEMTNDYRIILPLMFAVTISIVIAQRLQRESVYTLALSRKGVRLERGRDVELLEGIRVDEVMETSPAVLHSADSLEHATEWLLQTRHHGVAVLDANERLCGILTLQDIEHARQPDEALPFGKSVGDCCTREVLTAYPDESISEAMRRMSQHDIGRLPVVARNDPRLLVGLLRRADMVRAYDVALTRRAELRHRTQQVRLGAYSGAKVQEITVRPDALSADKRVSEMVWPKNSVIASIRRGREIIVPRGDTVLKAGDVLVVVADDDARSMLRELCG